MQYKIIRSRRKTLGLEICEAALVVRAPMEVSDETVARFVERNRAWIDRQLSLAKVRLREADAQPPLTRQDILALAARAKEVIPTRVAHYADLLGVSYGSITVRNQRSKWGSCSAKGNLNFNCLLMLAPPEVLDAIVVHELCHRKEMNHSKAFWHEVLCVYPEYKKWEDWLKKNGTTLMRRMKNGVANADMQ